MKREEWMPETAAANLQYWTARQAGAAVGSVAAFEAGIFLAIARYSAGETLDAMRTSVRDAVRVLEHARTPLPLHEAEHYYPALWALSLSIVFGDPSPVFATRMAGQDLLIDRLLQLTNRNIVPKDKLLHPKAMQHLIAAIDAPKEASAAIESFLALWYAAMGPTPWHDTHLRQNPAFFGYWAFELAAFVKALHMSDGAFSKHTHYPKDLVHQRTYKVWIDDGKASAQPNAFGEVEQRMLAVQELMRLFMMGNDENAGDEKSLDENLKSLGKLLTATEGATEPEDPEALRLGFLKLLQSVTSIAQEAAQTDNTAAQSEQIAAMREMEKAFLEANPELANLTSEINQEAGLDISDTDRQQVIEASRSRLSSIHGSLESLIQDQQIGLEQLFEGIESLHQRLLADMGIAPEKPLKIYEEVSERVGKSLDEANKKNMITADFDWSSLWRKD